MKLRQTLAITCLLLPVLAVADEARFTLGLYVVVEDMAESKQFYQTLFETEPYIDNGDFVGFSVAGNLFSLFAKSSFDHPLTRGNNVVPYIRVNEIEREFERIKAFAPKMVHGHVLDEGPIRLFMFLDPSGNPIEFYSVGSE